MPRLRLLLPALAVLAAAGVLLLTGREDPAPRADPSALVQQAFANAAPVVDGRLALALDVASRPGAQDVALRVEGPFAARAAQGVPRFDLTVRAGGLETALVSTGEAGFVRLAGTPYRLDAATWARLREGFAGGGAGSRGAALPRLGLDPAAWLRDPREVGRRAEDGVQVAHLRARAEPAALARDLAGLVATARALGGGGGAADGAGGASDGGGAADGAGGASDGGGAADGAGGASDRGGAARGAGDAAEAATAPLGADLLDATVDLWTGAGDGSLRRLAVRGTLAPRSAGAPPGTLRLDLRYSDLNTGVTVPEPEGARPLAELGAVLAAGATPAQERSYARCVRRAREDPAALQRCARRLAPGGA